MNHRLSLFVLLPLLTCVGRSSAQVREAQVVNGHVPSVVKNSHLIPVDRLPAAQQMYLVINLPHRNEPMLRNLLQQLYDPSNPKFHRFLTPAQFAEQFGPTEEDYRAVLAFGTLEWDDRETDRSGPQPGGCKRVGRRYRESPSARLARLSRPWRNSSLLCPGCGAFAGSPPRGTAHQRLGQLHPAAPELVAHQAPRSGCAKAAHRIGFKWLVSGRRFSKCLRARHNTHRFRPSSRTGGV